MPRGDRTGPAGMGPRTGRAAGYCAGYDMPGYANPLPGQGMGAGLGGSWGRGWRHRHWYYATGLPGWARSGFAQSWSPLPYQAPTKEQELNALQERAAWLKEQVEAVERRMTELSSE